MALSYEDIKQKLYSILDSDGNVGIRATYPDHVIIYDYKTRKYYQVPYTLNNEDITVGEFTEVEKETNYKPVVKVNTGAEVQNVESVKKVKLEESNKLEDEKMEIEITIIEEGFGNEVDNHYYTQQAVESGKDVFKGKKMFCDHPTRTSNRERPERSLRDWVATIKETWVDGDKLKGKAKVHADWFWKLVKEAYSEIGVSINAYGKASKGMVDNKTAYIISEITRGKSVDFVTEAGAGGKIDKILESIGGVRSMEIKDVKTMEELLQEIKESNPSLYDEYSKNVKLQESKKEVTKETTGNDSSKLENMVMKLAESVKTLTEAQQSNIQQSKIEKLLKESKLPDLTQAKLMNSLKSTIYKDDENLKESVKEAVKEERQYLAQLTESGKIKGISFKEVEVSESGEDKLTEAQKSMDELFGIEGDETDGK
ncbi:hypothetical protein [Vallitalea guaymasensis]|uniref:hypothetical protein n=1 Tax=Vallitalea guaymasensis TaxID=1185412 RepID=UPI000DE31434|nr:hypothetical protein [Vallitalea guaymasensis]